MIFFSSSMVLLFNKFPVKSNSSISPVIPGLLPMVKLVDAGFGYILMLSGLSVKLLIPEGISNSRVSSLAASKKAPTPKSAALDAVTLCPGTAAELLAVHIRHFRSAEGQLLKDSSIQVLQLVSKLLYQDIRR